MNDPIDKRIAELEKELAALRRQKLVQLQREVAALEASLTGGESAVSTSATKGRTTSQKVNRGWVADIIGTPESGPKKRGRRKGKYIPDEDALARLTKVVNAAGKDGISARQAAATTGLFYPRVIGLMDKTFKKNGTGKWTRYFSK